MIGSTKLHPDILLINLLHGLYTLFHFLTRVKNGILTGFEVSTNGCCGTGLFEASFLCNPKSLACPDASKFVFFDSIHPTEKTYYFLFNSLRKTVDGLLKD